MGEVDERPGIEAMEEMKSVQDEVYDVSSFQHVQESLWDADQMVGERPGFPETRTQMELLKVNHLIQME